MFNVHKNAAIVAARNNEIKRAVGRREAAYVSFVASYKSEMDGLRAENVALKWGMFVSLMISIFLLVR